MPLASKGLLFSHTDKPLEYQYDKEQRQASAGAFPIAQPFPLHLYSACPVGTAK